MLLTCASFWGFYIKPFSLLDCNEHKYKKVLRASCLCKITCWIVKHWVQREWIQTWCISVSCSPANDPARGELPRYLYLGHCFELCNTFIFRSTRLLSHAGTDPLVSMQQMQSVYTFSHVLGPCHGGQNFLGTLTDRSAGTVQPEEDQGVKQCFHISPTPAAVFTHMVIFLSPKRGRLPGTLCGWGFKCTYSRKSWFRA